MIAEMKRILPEMSFKVDGGVLYCPVRIYINWCRESNRTGKPDRETNPPAIKGLIYGSSGIVSGEKQGRISVGVFWVDLIKPIS
jgi:hypothetical protein